LTNSSTSSISQPATKSKSTRFGWTGAAGLAISALLVWWALHDVSPSEIWAHVSGIKVLPFGLAIGTATLTFPLRTIRWQYLLRLEGEKLPFVPLWHATAIGFMATNLLPARAGEFARAYAARRLTGAPFTTAFASLAVERMIDGVTLVILLMTASWAGGFGANTTIGAVTLGEIARSASVFFLGILVVTIVIVQHPKRAQAIISAITQRVLPVRWADKVMRLVQGLLLGLDSLRSPKRFLAVLFWSLIVWLTGAASLWIGLHAFAIEVPWSAAIMLQSLLAFGVAVQFSPGFFGQWEVICRYALALYGVPAGPAVSYAFGYHLGGFVPITVLGMWSLSRAHLHLTDLKAGEYKGFRKESTDTKEVPDATATGTRESE
jgi:uncharacterized protein (TIRG00374 family)